LAPLFLGFIVFFICGEGWAGLGSGCWLWQNISSCFPSQETHRCLPGIRSQLAGSSGREHQQGAAADGVTTPDDGTKKTNLARGMDVAREENAAKKDPRGRRRKAWQNYVGPQIPFFAK